MITDEHPAVFWINGNPVGVGQMRVIPFQGSDRFVLTIRHLAIYIDLGRMLDRQVKLLRFLVHGNAISPVRSMQRPHRLYVSLRVARKHGHRIDGIVVDRINVTALWIDIKTAVKFQLGQESSQHPLRLGKGGAGGSIIGSIEYFDPKQILVLEKYFIRIGVYGNGAVSWISIVNDPKR